LIKREPVPSEDGDTLIEVLLAVVILGLSVVALLGALVTSITSSSEHRSLASDDTVLRSFAEAAKYEIQMQPGALFVDCAKAYRVVNVYPSSGPVGTFLTVFGTDFDAGDSVSVTLGSTALSAMTSGSTVNQNGNVAATFAVPVIPAGSYPVVLSDGSNSAPSATNFVVTPSLGALSPGSGPSGTSVTVSASGFEANTALSVTVNGTTATVTSGSPTGANGNATGAGSTLTFTIPTGLTTGTTYPVKVSDGINSASSRFTAATSAGGPSAATAVLTSAVSGTSVGISRLQWWNSSSLHWDDSSTQSCSTQDQSGIQQITLTATAVNGVSDQLSFIVTCPGCSPPAPAPTVAIGASSPTFGQSETFTFTLTGYTTCPTNEPSCVLYPECPTSQPNCIQWTLTGPGTPAPACTNTALTQLTGTTNISQSTCVVNSVLAGIYGVTANYSGDTNYSPTAGYGSVTVPKATPTNVVTNTPKTVSGTVTFTATLTGSAGVTPTGTVTWMVSGSAGTTSCTSSTTTLNASGNATCTITLSHLGSYVVSDSYSGDSNYSAVTSNADSYTFATPGLVQANYATCTSSCGTQTVSFTNPTTAGDLIVISVETYGGTSAPTVSDTSNGTYTETTENPVASYYEATAYVLNANSTLSVMVNTHGAGDMSVTIAEFSGYTSVDKSAGAKSTSGGTFSSGSVTTSYADDLLIGTIGSNGSGTITITGTGTYTATTHESVSNASEELAYEQVTSTGSYSFTGTGEGGAYWGAQILAFEG
jgi:Tfp pilus assembly protein PilV